MYRFQAILLYFKTDLRSDRLHTQFIDLFLMLLAETLQVDLK